MLRFLSLRVAAIGIVLSLLIFVTLRSLEFKNAQASFNGVAQERLDALETSVTLALNNRVSIGALFDHAGDVNRRQFDLFTAPLLARTQVVQALEWIRRASRAGRPQYGKQAQSEGFPQFRFIQRTLPDELIATRQRDEYFPVFFVAPFRGNEKALGCDLGADLVRRAALWSAGNSGELATTGRVKLVQETSDQHGFLVFCPVYAGGVEPPSGPQRRALTGFALAVFRVGDIVETPGTISGSASGLKLAIFDSDAQSGERLLYPKGDHLDGVEDIPRGFRATRSILVGGRRWLAACPLPGSFRPARWNSAAELLAGLLLTLLLSLHLAQRKRAEASLRLSEERARLLFSTIPHPAYVFDIVTLNFIEVNDAAVQTYGYRPEEFLRMKVTDIRSPDEAGRLRNLLKGPSQRGVAGQWKHRTKDGRELDVEVYYQNLHYDGHDARFVIAQDVTERNRMEINLRHAQKLEAVGSLAAGIAHEINSPIQFIGDNTRFLAESLTQVADLLKHYARLRDQVAQGCADRGLAQEIAKIEQAIDIDFLLKEGSAATAQSLDGVSRVATLVRAMKEFAHPDQKDKSPADINAALQSTLIVARNELKYVAEVETEFANLPLVICHIGEVNQVFLNLLINAAHAIGEVKKQDGPKGIIRVQTALEKDWVVISIGDTGCGIPEKIRGRIFDPFFTTKEVGRGTGQGLAIARSVVQRNGGKITFSSEVGKGTTFQVRLPLNQDPPAPGPS